MHISEKFYGNFMEDTSHAIHGTAKTFYNLCHTLLLKVVIIV